MTEQQDAYEQLDRYAATTIPVRVDLTSQQTVLDLTEAETILRAAGTIALLPCACRTEKHRCDAPTDVCLSLDAAAERALETVGGARQVTLATALDVLRLSHEAGLVHLAYRQDGRPISEFCSCCPCCCWYLTRVRELGAFEAVAPSGSIVVRDDAACIGCGTCVDRCAFDAWLGGESGGPTADLSRCRGCGVCVTACPAGALELVARGTR